MNTVLLAPVLGCVAALAFSGQAHAQRESNVNGQRLVQLCTGDRVSIEACDAYVNGVADAAGFYQRLRPQDGSKGATLPAYICIPGPTTGAQLRETVVQWFQRHPDNANRQASGVVLRALDETFKCPGER